MQWPRVGCVDEADVETLVMQGDYIGGVLRRVREGHRRLVEAFEGSRSLYNSTLEADSTGAQGEGGLRWALAVQCGSLLGLGTQLADGGAQLYGGLEGRFEGGGLRMRSNLGLLWEKLKKGDVRQTQAAWR